MLAVSSGALVRALVGVLDERELRELAALLGAALAWVSADNNQIDIEPIEVPAEVCDQLVERVALVATLQWACSTYPQLREAIKARFRHERDRVSIRCPTVDMPGKLDETRELIDDRLAALRGAANRDDELRRELVVADAWPGWWE